MSKWFGKLLCDFEIHKSSKPLVGCIGFMYCLRCHMRLDFYQPSDAWFKKNRGDL